MPRDVRLKMPADSARPPAAQITATETGLRRFAVVSIVLSIIGWFAAFELLTEYIGTLIDPNYQPACDISPLVACGPNMGSWQGSVFGFPNPIIGVVAFAAPIIVGVAILAGARFAAWFWWLYMSGLLFGLGFVFWLSWQSVFRLGTLCPWCMVVWIIMVPLFWVTTTYVTSTGMAALPSGARGIAQTLFEWSWVLIVFTLLYLAVIAQIGVDWIAYLRIVLR